MVHCPREKEFHSFMMLSLDKHWHSAQLNLPIKIYKIVVPTGLTGSCGRAPGFLRSLLLALLQVRYCQGRVYGIHYSITYPPEARPMLLLAGAASSRVGCITGWARQLFVGGSQIPRGKAFLGVERRCLLLLFQFVPWFGLLGCHRALFVITCTITYTSLSAESTTFTWLVCISGFLSSIAVDADFLFRSRVRIYGGTLGVSIEQQ